MILKEAYSRGYPESASCVQRFDDSLNSAIRITYRISLRSSSSREPRYPLLRVVFYFVFFNLKFLVFCFCFVKVGLREKEGEKKAKLPEQKLCCFPFLSSNFVTCLFLRDGSQGCLKKKD